VILNGSPLYLIPRSVGRRPRMPYPIINNIPYEEIENGALILLLLRDCKSWEELCKRYSYADPTTLGNTNTMMLARKLEAMRDLGLITFEEIDVPGGKLPEGEIKATDLWSRIRVACGGMSMAEAAMLSRHSKGMAVFPAFGRPPESKEKIDIFVLMPFKAKLTNVYTDHIKSAVEALELTIRRADEIYSPEPFMTKVWQGICAAQLVLADCTEKNANVFYEIGIAHTVGKKVVLITRSDKDIPSDIKHFDYIPYSETGEGIALLQNRLKEFLQSYFATLSLPAGSPPATAQP
jgi:hypothetical protein